MSDGVKKGCNGCYYWVPINFGDNPNTVLRFCSYILHTGHKRPCEAGYACTVRKEKTKRAKEH